MTKPFLLILLIATMLPGCSRHQVAVDIINYVNQGLLNISGLESRALESYNAVAGSNYTSSDAMRRALKNDTIPLYRRYLELLRQIRPGSQEVQQLHAATVRAAEMIYEGFRTKLVGLEINDLALMSRGNELIAAGTAATADWKQHLEQLKREYGVRTE